MTRVVHTRAELRSALAETSGEVGVVMTMGALHDGHRRLISVARKRCAVTVVTVFLNPLQFAPTEDLSRYPRTLDSDVVLCKEEGVDLVFAPSAAEVYPLGEQPLVRIDAGPLGDVLEGASRPGHFDGVLTVVSKLFHIVQPDHALFGQKDAQQVFLVPRMVRDLDLPVGIEVVPTVREPDGLAMSSRNRYLDAEQRRIALALSESLAAAEAAASDGLDEVLAEAAGAFGDHDGIELDYLVVVDPDTFLPVVEGVAGPARVLVAARVGATRLIDNGLVSLA